MLKILSAAALLLATTAAIDEDYGAARQGAIVDGANQTMTLDCKGGPAIIDGADNRVRFTGICSSLFIDGAYNVVSINLAPGANIKIDGAYNKINWRSTGKQRPRVTAEGAGNQIVRVR